MKFEKDEDFRPKTRITKKDELDYDLVKRLASIQCKNSEIAYVLGCSERSLREWIKEDEKLSEAIEEGYAKGKMSVRRAQFQLALPDPDNGYHGNPKMLIWLGKQILHQSEKVEVGGSKEPIKINLVWGDLPKEDNNTDLEISTCEEDLKA